MTGSGAARVWSCDCSHLVEVGYAVVLHARRSLDEVKQTAQSWSSEGLPVSYVTVRSMIGSNAQACAKRYVSDMVVCMCWSIQRPHGSRRDWEELDEAKLLEQWRVN